MELAERLTNWTKPQTTSFTMPRGSAASSMECGVQRIITQVITQLGGRAYGTIGA